MCNLTWELETEDNKVVFNVSGADLVGRDDQYFVL